MINIKISIPSGISSEQILRQTPGQTGVWHNCKFYIKNELDKYDWWVIFHESGLRHPEVVRCDANHTIYVSMEPNENVSRATHLFLDQFSSIIICDRNISHKNKVYKNLLTWWVGINVNHKNGSHHFSKSCNLDYDLLSAMKFPEKYKLISIITSSKLTLPGHQKRIDFLNKLLKSNLGDKIDVFGGGYKPIPDKINAILPYKYHLVLENSFEMDYWSEKLADAFLGFSYPIYYGCPNINEYFSHGSYSTIDIEDFENSLIKIHNILDENVFEKSHLLIKNSRELVLNKYNIFQLLSDICNCKAENSVDIKILPNWHFKEFTLKKLLKKLIRF